MIAEQLYRVSLLLLPRWFRARFATEMTDSFVARYAAATTLGGIGLALREIGSVVRLGLAARWRGRALLALGPEVRSTGAGASGPTPPHRSRFALPREIQSMESLWQDTRYALRSLRQAPGFTAVATATLALGIGVNTTIFSIVNAVLLRPLPVRDPGSVVELYSVVSGPTSLTHSALSVPDLADFADQVPALAAVTAHSLFMATVSEAGRSELTIGEIVRGNYFEALGVTVSQGRALAPDDDVVPDGHAVVVISHDFWQRRMQSAADVVGRSLRLNGIPFEIVGVAEPGFGGMVFGVSPSLWIPVMMAEQVEPMGINDVSPSASGTTRLDRRGHRWLWGKARLRPGATLEEARAGLATVAQRLAGDFPDSNENYSATALPAGSMRVHPLLDAALVPAAGFLLAIVGMVLLVACANVANMLLARASTRRKEVAIRLAIGAGRTRLVRQLLTESLLLAALGGLLGLMLAAWVAGLISRVRPPLPVDLPLAVSIDVRVFGFALLAAGLTGMLFGLVPALQASRPDLVPALKDATARRRGRRFELRQALVVLQVAVSLVLLFGGALLTRSALSARGVDVGLQPDRLAVFGFGLQMNGYDDERAQQFYRDARRRLAAFPGVDAATFATRLPFDINFHTASVYAEGQPAGDDDPGVLLDVTRAGPSYFETLAIPVLRGRVFDARDTPESPHVVVVNEAFAQRFWPGQSAVGKQLRVGTVEAAPVEIIGVVANHDVRTVSETPRPYLHFSIAQSPSPFSSLVIRASGAARPLVASLQRELLQMEPDLVFMESGTLADVMGITLLPVRAGAGALGLFGGLALALAAVGLYGVIAYSVSQRTHELGIRKALGAKRGDVVRLVVRQGMSLVLVGIAVGAVAAVTAARLLTGVLYEVGPTDPIAIGGAALTLLGVALLANYIPARRASRVEAMLALRNE